MLETGIDLPCGGYRTLVICIFAGIAMMIPLSYV
ncbi:MAG: hypothetical protein J07HQW2_02932 [Haloquadratum walsbyi J07HQW2]|uniref:Uncharacterized protein n=1 Tax=Haloquadratum walsbyi J07HQW2 TaxID=1238425 RepID=U1PPZ0_9EURY|nr:MAG: hypothetical protein J07HQW2_00795 [Haloquadratum walsbyi J07HQW2]ERG96453.1 MAG: hypothetical protein J07HQW2_02932 [Haloquadratum walsbyi J07HQW2]